MSAELTVNKQIVGLLDPVTWNTLRDQVSVLVKSGLLRKAIDTPEKAIAMVLKGSELGLPLMAALNGISVVNGATMTDGQTMLALIFSRVPGASVDWLERTDKLCRLEASRPGRKTTIFEFTMEDAKRAGLDQKPGPWKQYPRVMLQWRAVSEMGKAMFPDVLAGVYLEDEVDSVAIDVTPPKRDAKAMEALLSGEATPDAPEPVKMASRASVDLMLEEFAKINFPAEVILDSVLAKDRDSVSEANMEELRAWYAVERDKHAKTQK
jgi:hypothetical protein